MLSTFSKVQSDPKDADNGLPPAEEEENETSETEQDMDPSHSNGGSTRNHLRRLESVGKQGHSKSTLLPKVHDTWHEASNIYNWKIQAQIIVLCQMAHPVVQPLAIFFHFFLKRDWGMAFGPFFAFAIYGDARSLDLFLAASMGGVVCGALKHMIRSPRPFWIIPEVFLKQGVEEMSWGTPSAHSAIQGAISAVLLYYDPTSVANWIVNAFLLLFCMYSRLYLAVHWPQDVLLGAVIGVASGFMVCSSTLHDTLVTFSHDHHEIGGLIYLVVGFGYFLVVYVVVKVLDRISDRRPVPEGAILRYQLGVARSLRILQQDPGTSLPDVKKQSANKEKDGDLICGNGIRATSSINSMTSRRRTLSQIRVNNDQVWLDTSSLPLPNDEELGVGNEETISESPHSCRASTSVLADDGDMLDQMCLYAPEEAQEVMDAVSKANNSYYFLNLHEIEAMEAKTVQNEKQTVFFRRDVAFNPDTKERFWYNAINVLGSYCGLAMYACIVDQADVEFKPRMKWLAAIYATGISFSLIVYTRSTLRSMLSRKQFKFMRSFVYFFIGFFTYGLFPYSYLILMNSHKE